MESMIAQQSAKIETSKIIKKFGTELR